MSKRSGGGQVGGWESNFQGLIELAPAYFYVASADDVAVTLYRSPQARTTLGYDDDEWRSNPNLWVEILHPDDRDRVLGEFRAGVHGEEPFRTQYRIFAKDGRMLWVRDHAAVVPNPMGSGKIVQGVVLDITDQVGAEQARMRAEVESDAMARLLSGMSHEFRTPLNAILGFAELLRGAGPDPLTERQRRYLAHIHDSGQRLLEMVNQLLEVTRLQAGQLRLVIGPTDLPAAVERAVGAVRQNMATTDVRIEAEVPPAIVEADASFLHQAVLNLVGEAVRSAAAKVVEVSAEVVGSAVSVRISDDPDRTRQSPTGGGAPPGPALSVQLAGHLLGAMGGELACRGSEDDPVAFSIRLRLAGRSGRESPPAGRRLRRASDP